MGEDRFKRLIRFRRLCIPPSGDLEVREELATHLAIVILYIFPSLVLFCSNSHQHFSPCCRQASSELHGLVVASPDSNLYLLRVDSLLLFLWLFIVTAKRSSFSFLLVFNYAVIFLLPCIRTCISSSVKHNRQLNRSY